MDEEIGTEEVVDNEEVVEQAIEAPQTNEDTTDEVIGLEIPEGLEDGLKEYISSIEDINGRNAHINKFKSFNDGYLKKLNDVATDRKSLETEREEVTAQNHFYGGYKALEGELGEHKGAIEANFGNAPAYYRWLHEQNVSISDDPVNYALRLLKSNGVDQTNIGESFSSDSYKDSQSQNDMGQFKEQLTQSNQEMMQNWKLDQEIAQFSQALNTDGTPKHPHFEAVRGTMGSLQGNYPQADYEMLYDMACKIEPSISTDYIQSQVTKEAESIVQKKDVAKAKSVIGVKSSVDSVGKTQKLGWQDQLRQDLDNQ